MTRNTAAAPSVVMHTVGEAAAKAKISERYLWMRIADGTGPDVTRIGRRVLIRDDRLDAWIEHLTETPEPQMDYDVADRAALTVLAAVKKNVVDNDPEGGLQVLRGSAREVSLRLAEATNIIVYLCRLSDRPQQMLAALTEAVTKTHD